MNSSKRPDSIFCWTRIGTIPRNWTDSKSGVRWPLSQFDCLESWRLWTDEYNSINFEEGFENCIEKNIGYGPCIGKKRVGISLKPHLSRKNENGIIEAGSHLVIIDGSSCDQTNAEQLSDPKILNYYRQFLIEGLDDWYVEWIARAS